MKKRIEPVLSTYLATVSKLFQVCITELSNHPNDIVLIKKNGGK